MKDELIYNAERNETIFYAMGEAIDEISKQFNLSERVATLMIKTLSDSRVKNVFDGETINES